MRVRRPIAAAAAAAATCSRDVLRSTGRPTMDVRAIGDAVSGAIGGMAHLKVRGLMAVAPAVERPEDSRPAFRALRALAERDGLGEVSMGMSGDFEVAVEEGATMVRVGTAIFGPRPLNMGAPQ